MNTLYMKIVNYEENTGSFLVCFASDETQHQDPEKYEPLSFQPAIMWPNVSDINEYPLLMAKSGLFKVTSIAAQEKLLTSSDRTNLLKGLVGISTTYDVADLSTTPVKNTV